MKLTFVKMGINGEGIAYLNHIPVFCDGVLPSETAEVRIIEEQPHYKRAELLKLLQESKYRIKPAGFSESECGFPLMTLQYEQQLVYKKQLLEEALFKYGNVRSTFIRDMHASPVVHHYRSECKLPFGMRKGSLCNGLYQPGTNHFVPVSHFSTHTEELEDARMDLIRLLNKRDMKAFDPKTHKGLRFLVLRVIDGHGQCTLVTGKDKLDQELVDEILKIKGIDSLYQSVNGARNPKGVFGRTEHLGGEEQLSIKVNGIQLQLSPESFFQLNVRQAAELYRMAVSKIDPCKEMVEAYCGIGAMSLMAHEKAEHITGIEYSSRAVQNARKNAEINGIHNCSFTAGDAGEKLKEICRDKKIDALLADPPRAGMDQAMIDAILSSDISRIVYISCNSATLGKNIHDLKKEYTVRTVIPYDMFPDTPHVESITVLTRNGTSDRTVHKKKKKMKIQ